MVAARQKNEFLESMNEFSFSVEELKPIIQQILQNNAKERLAMQGMDSKKEMDQMNMTGMDMKNNRMDAFRFEDNNPALKKLKSESKE